MSNRHARKKPSLKLTPSKILIVVVLIVIAILNQPAEEEIDNPPSETSSATLEVAVSENEDEKTTNSTPKHGANRWTRKNTKPQWK